MWCVWTQTFLPNSFSFNESSHQWLFKIWSKPLWNVVIIQKASNIKFYLFILEIVCGFAYRTKRYRFLNYNDDGDHLWCLKSYYQPGSLSRSSHHKCSVKKYSQILQILPEACKFIKKSFFHWCFAVNFTKFLRTPSLQKKYILEETNSEGQNEKRKLIWHIF